MISFRKILIDIDALAEAHPALEAAVQLAKRCGAQLKVADVVPSLPWPVRRAARGAIEQDLVSHREERLAALAARLTAEGIDVRCAVLRGRAAQALTKEVIEEGHDLLIRAHGRAARLDPQPRFGAIDMQLLRICPCPLWLVGARPVHRPLRVLLAVHTDPEDPAEQQMNQRIADSALAVIGQESVDVTVLQAWDAFGAQLLRSRMRPDEVAAYVESARTSASNAFDDFVASIRPRFAQLKAELLQGDPAEVIQTVTEREEIDLVVMGTVARSGLPGLLMGNTAEAVLQRLRCSVLAVKPEGFRSSLAQSAESAVLL